jgi:hypothetical protein
MCGRIIRIIIIVKKKRRIAIRLGLKPSGKQPPSG